jgi:hypothetical protein
VRGSYQWKGPLTRTFESGEGQNRTADTAIFSRVLCQLSYLAHVPGAPAEADENSNPPRA